MWKNRVVPPRRRVGSLLFLPDRTMLPIPLRLSGLLLLQRSVSPPPRQPPGSRLLHRKVKRRIK